MSENEKLEQDDLTAAAEAEAEATVAKVEKPAKKDTKDAKPAKKEKPGFFARIARWLREMKSELKKVQWPTLKQTMNNVLIVIVCVIIVGVFIWVFDWLARLVIEALLNLAGKA